MLVSIEGARCDLASRFDAMRSTNVVEDITCTLKRRDLCVEYFFSRVDIIKLSTGAVKIIECGVKKRCDRRGRGREGERSLIKKES